MSNEHQLNQIAEAFKESGHDQISLSEICDTLGLIALDMSEPSLTAAMSIRGIDYANGILSIQQDQEAVIPVKADYGPFIVAVKEIMDMATAPIPVGELIGMTGLATEAIPMGGFSPHLKSSGVHYIPGAGYWKHPQYARPNGKLLYSEPRHKTTARMMEAFKIHGWPLSGIEIEHKTGGEVTSRFMTTQAAKPMPLINSIGGGIFVPAGATPTEAMPIPMTSSVAEAILNISPDYEIYRSENPRIYKLATLLEKHAMANVRHLWKVRAGKRQRLLCMELTEYGRKILSNLDRRIAKDEF